MQHVVKQQRAIACLLEKRENCSIGLIPAYSLSELQDTVQKQIDLNSLITGVMVSHLVKHLNPYFCFVVIGPAVRGDGHMLVMRAQDGNISPGLAPVHGHHDFSMFQQLGIDQLGSPSTEVGRPHFVHLIVPTKLLFLDRSISVSGREVSKLSMGMFLSLVTKGSTNFSPTLSFKGLCPYPAVSVNLCPVSCNITCRLQYSPLKSL